MEFLDNTNINRKMRKNAIIFLITIMVEKT
jgi:hypothetical protein